MRIMRVEMEKKAEKKATERKERMGGKVNTKFRPSKPLGVVNSNMPDELE